MISQLCARIWNNERFQVDLLAFREEALRIGLGLGNGQRFPPDIITSLLQAAAALSASEIDQHREAAYDIATGSFNGYRGELSGIEEILYLTLARIGNFPAIGLLQSTSAPPESRLFCFRFFGASRI